MNAIDFIDVSFHYYPGFNVFKNLNFSIKNGHTTVILGKNGSGKSTLLKLIMRFEIANTGKIKLKNSLISEYTVLNKSKIIAYVGQDTFVQLDFSVKDYLLFGSTNKLGFVSIPNKKHEQLVVELAEQFGITHLLSKRMDKISGGEKQIVAICRAFVQGSEMIVMDEPLSFLDFANQNRILKLIKHLSGKGRTIIFTTHNPNHALYLNSDVLFLSDSKLIAEGNAREVLTVDLLNLVYDNSVGRSKDHPYDEFTLKNDEV